MKRIAFAILALVLAISPTSAQRLSNVSVEARYITDMMAMELGLTNVQRNSILQLNINYLNSIGSYRDIGSSAWKKRNRSVKSLLNASQWRLFKGAYYFYRPIGWNNGAYVHNIYVKYPKKHGYDRKHEFDRKHGHDRKHEFDRKHGRKKNNDRRERTFGSRR